MGETKSQGDPAGARQDRGVASPALRPSAAAGATLGRVLPAGLRDAGARADARCRVLPAGLRDAGARADARCRLQPSGGGAWSRRSLREI